MAPAVLADLRAREREAWFSKRMSVVRENPLVAEIRANERTRSEQIRTERAKWDAAKHADWQQQLAALQVEASRQEAELLRQEREAQAALEAELRSWEQQALAELAIEKSDR
jgi:hypothetical protein